MSLNKSTALLRLLCFSLFGFISSTSATHADQADPTSNNVHIHTLAASCAACHGTQGNSHSITPVLAGLDADYFSAELLAFKNGQRKGTVMQHHATGLTDAEIRQLADYFSTQKRTSQPPLKSQTLKDKP